jgi:hypothetical protein
MPRYTVERRFRKGLHVPATDDRPDPESIRTGAEQNGPSVDQITRVSVLDPRFDH